jgi:hypothetical protein
VILYGRKGDCYMFIIFTYTFFFKIVFTQMG